MAGSSTCLNTAVARPLPDLDIDMYASPARPGAFMTETGIDTAGEAVDWLAGLAYGGRGGRPRAGDYELLDSEAAGVPAGSDGLLFVPVLGDGERDDPLLRGTVTGLSLRHGRAAWARATMEGVALGMRVLLETLSRGRSPAAELRVSGQAAGLRGWNQVKADVLGIPVLQIPGDATAAGVAMLAGIGVGAYSGPDEAVAAACHPADPVLPGEASRGLYDELFGRYRAAVASDLARVPAPAPAR